MATKKTTTKAKTKTTKKTTRTTKKPAAKASAKSTKKAVATKVSKPTSRRNSKDNGPIKQIRALNIAGVLAAAVLALMVALFMSPTYLQKTLSYVTENSLSANGATELVAAERILLDYDIRWLLMALAVFAGVYTLLNATRWRASYEKAIAERVYFWRWVSVAIGGALIIGLAASLAGLTSVFTIKLMASMAVLSAALSWSSERQFKSNGRPIWSTYVLAVFAGLLPWLIVAVQMWATYVYGLTNMPWHVYAVAGAGLLGSLGLSLNQFLYMRGRLKSYESVERNYLVLSLAALMAVSGVLIAGFWK